MCILATLGLSSLLRLKRTWKIVPDKYKDMHSQLEELMSSAHNYKNYRLKLEASPRPILPYLGFP